MACNDNEQRDIEMTKFIIGKSIIKKNCQFNGVLFQIGDCSTIFEKCRFLTTTIKIGDYAKIHNHVTILGENDCIIGHNFWCGEYTFLNCHENLIIGNNVAIGRNNTIWTHVRAGELLIGSKLNTAKPVVIEDDVWICGNNSTIYPGVVLKQGSVVMPNSVVTKDTKPWTCYGGIPAREINIIPWGKPSLKKQLLMMEHFVNEFINLKPKYRNTFNKSIEIVLNEKQADIHSAKSIFCIEDRKYLKHMTGIEIEFMKFLVSYRAKFVPYEVR